MTEQLGFKLFLMVMSGVALCVLVLIVWNSKSSAARRKKTKLGLVKVAGSGLKLDEGGADGPAGTDGAGEAAGEVAGDADEVSFERQPEVPGGSGAVAAGPAASEPAADKPASEPDDEPADFEADEEAAETIAVPRELIDDDEDGDDGQSAGDSEPESRAHHADDGSGLSASKFTYDNYKLEPDDDETPDDDELASDRGPAAPPPPKRRVPETVKLKERKVLVAEDVAVNRELIVMFFEGSGVKLDLAEDGEQACELFEKHPEGYSLVLMDIQMPVLDGYDAARRIRAHDADWAKQIPIIAMTANIFKEDIDLCFEAGMDDHIAKPINMEELQSKVFDIIMQGTE